MGRPLLRFLPSLVLLVTVATRAGAAPPPDPVAAGRRWIGLTTGIHHEHVENTPVSLQDVTLGNASSWNVNLAYGKFVRNGAMLGGGLAYDHASSDVTTALPLGRDQRVEQRSSTMTGSVALRNYLPLGNPHFYLYNQLGLSAGYTWGQQTTTTDTSVGSDLSGQRYALELKPGIAVMIDKGFAAELSVNVLGLSYQSLRTTTPGAPDSYQSSTDLNFELSLLKLGLGFTCYF